MVEQLVECQEVEVGVICFVFMEKLDVDEEVVDILIVEGFLMLEEVVYVLLVEMLEIDVFDEVIVNELCDCVCNVFLIEVISDEEQFEGVEEVMFNFDGMDKSFVVKLVCGGIKNCDDFVDLVVDELIEMMGIDEECVKVFIIKVCVYWFMGEV